MHTCPCALSRAVPPSPPPSRALATTPLSLRRRRPRIATPAARGQPGPQPPRPTRDGSRVRPSSARSARPSAAQQLREREAAQAAQTLGDQIISLASQEAGDPYVYGAAGPDAFDCSGFTQYVFAQVGISLPHSSSAQAGIAQPVSDPVPGDLVFFTGSRRRLPRGASTPATARCGTHPHSGAVVSQEPIWTSSVFYGRVG